MVSGEDFPVETNPLIYGHYGIRTTRWVYIHDKVWDET